MRKTKPLANEVYHLYNRGVEKRKVFMDESDYFRFIHGLFEFNDTAPALNLYHKTEFNEVGLRKIEALRSQRHLLVEILSFCLMPNHYHLMVRSKKSSGITEFMRKLGTGYTNYFNQKYDRVGALFQGKYKSKIIDTNEHLAYLPYYVHLNPLSLENFSSKKETFEFLEKYRWSSHLDYSGKKNFPSITHREFLTKIIGGTKQYNQNVADWVKEPKVELIREILLD